jgi:primosomal protein N' (replication factor Y)
MRYAEVSVNSPIAQRRTFSYRVPDGLSINIGQAVWVPFGNKILQGIVLELTSSPAVEETRDISGIIDPVPLLSPAQVEVARWISGHYLTPLFEAVALMLPPGFERRVVAWFSQSSESSVPHEPLDVDQQAVLDVVISKVRVSQKELEKSVGIRRAQKAVFHLLHRNLIHRSFELEKERIKPRLVSYLALKISPDQAVQAVSELSVKTPKQAGLLRLLLDSSQPMALSIAREKLKCSSVTVKALVDKGLIETREVRVDRDPLAYRSVNLSFPLPLTTAQRAAFSAICDSLGEPRALPSKPEVFLLHGVTGSGKTEMYIRALDEAVKLGKRGIVLVPEISMTPQIIERFISRFPGRVAVLHSGLTLGEQFDEWWRIKNGEFAVVIGPRSALFAPQPDLGLIIIDEEHEWTYKQDDSPRYHARQAAVKMAELTGATVVLGSATPDVESYYRTQSGEYRLLELPQRVTSGEGTPLPAVEIVDLKAELKAGNLSLFSRSLHNSIEAALQNHEQVLLFLNRRGGASFIECRNCGLVIRCKRCELPLSYHFAEEVLICHQCNYHMKVPLVCPDCRSRRIKYLGVGTEKLEQETARVFPQARLLRWDSDIVQGHSRAHREIFEKFRAREADILIGTQMVAKGLDLPGVTLVGVVSADITLNLPDFRAGERTFQLLSQVAGRAGRGAAGGKVILQTYSPEHYSVRAAAGHDYLSLYNREITYRRDLNYPPYSRLARLVFTHASEVRCRQEMERMQKLLIEEKDARGAAGTSLIGPAPAFIHRLRGQYRWQLILRSPEPAEFLSKIAFPRGWSIDIDPIGLT